MLRRRRLLTGVLTIFAALCVAYFALRGDVSRPSLSHSVAGEVGGGFYASCLREAHGAWGCELMSSDASDAGIRYRVLASGRCWRGSRVASGGMTGLPPSISGCVGLLDRLRIDDRLGDTPGATYRDHGFY